MKKLIVPTLILLACLACRTLPHPDMENEVNPKSLMGINDLGVVEQTWKLVQMTAGMVNSQTTGADMDWQESYTFKPDGTFLKTRETNGTTQTASGLYVIENLTDGTYVKLTFQSGTEIIGNCTGNDEEQLYVPSNDKLQGTWLACDGPGLTYEQI